MNQEKLKQTLISFSEFLESHGADGITKGVEMYAEEFARITLENKSDDSMYETCLNIAKGCHDYNGGHHQKETNEAFHHGIQTVVNCLERLGKVGLNDSQLSVVYNIGKQNENTQSKRMD